MSAHFRCYDPKSGQITFDLQSHTSRLLAVFGADVNEKTHTFSDDEIGGGELFWYTANPIGMSILLLRENQVNINQYNALVVNITGNQVYFKKHQDITLFIGVKV